MFNDNDNRDNYLRNKLINSLFNNKLYNNNNKIINIFTNEIVKLLENFENKYNTCELLLKVMKFHQHPKKISKIIKIILKNIPNNEFQQILIYMREIKYLKNIINVEIIFNFIIENALDKYKNNIYIQDSLYKIFEELTNINDYNLIIIFLKNN